MISEKKYISQIAKIFMEVDAKIDVDVKKKINRNRSYMYDSFGSLPSHIRTAYEKLDWSVIDKFIDSVDSENAPIEGNLIYEKILREKSDEPECRQNVESSSDIRCRRRFNAIQGFLKPGGIGAEIGVFKGEFTAFLLSSLPSKLYAVDPWYRLSSIWSWAKSDQSTLRALCKILEEFQNEIDNKVLEPRVEFSEEFLLSLPDNYLDWVYIDSTHQYEQTLKELEICLKKVKSTGVIIGDDYHSDPSHKHYGVYRAVQQLKAECKLEILLDGQNSQFVCRKVLNNSSR
jgi:hypothetical protein